MARNNEFEREKQQLLEQLLHEVRATNDPKQQESVINKIAITILRSRPLCRQFNGTPLKGVYREIYNLARDNLQNHLYRHLVIKYEKQPNLYQIKQIQPSYLYGLQKQIFKNLLNDLKLKEMGLTAQKYSVNSELRTYALTELVRAIRLSGRLCRPHAHKFSAGLYSMLYEEAVADTLAYICLNIDLYDPNRGNRKFMNWVNFKLDKCVLKCYEKTQKYSRYELPSLIDLDNFNHPENTPDLAKILQEYLIQNPDNLFTNAHIRNRADANFSSIALAKLSGQTWEKISQQLNIPIPTLSSFYNRWCRRFAPLFKTELQKHF